MARIVQKGWSVQEYIDASKDKMKKTGATADQIRKTLTATELFGMLPKVTKYLLQIWNTIPPVSLGKELHYTTPAR